jgi:hypothetical protein
MLKVEQVLEVQELPQLLLLELLIPPCLRASNTLFTSRQTRVTSPVLASAYRILLLVLPLQLLLVVLMVWAIIVMMLLLLLLLLLVASLLLIVVVVTSSARGLPPPMLVQVPPYTGTATQQFQLQLVACREQHL